MNLTIADIPFIEQVADQLHPLPSLIEACGGLGDARHRWALAHVARRAADEDTIRAIADAADTGDAGDNDILTALARNPATPLDILLRLAANQYVMVSDLAASDPRIPAEETVRLVSGCLGSRMGVASNPNTPDTVLAKLAGDESGWVRPRARWEIARRAQGAVRMTRFVILAGAVAFLAGLVAGPGWAASVTAAASSVVILTAGWLRSRRSAPVPSAVAVVLDALGERS